MSELIRVVVTGVKGRMGEALVRRLRDEVDFQLVAGTDRKGASSIGLDVGLLLGLGAMEVALYERRSFAAARGGVCPGQRCTRGGLHGVFVCRQSANV